MPILLTKFPLQQPGRVKAKYLKTSSPNWSQVSLCRVWKASYTPLHHTTFHWTMSHPIPSRCTIFHRILYHLFSFHLTSSHLICSPLISSHLVSLYLISSYLISSHLLSSPLLSYLLICYHSIIFDWTVSRWVLMLCIGFHMVLLARIHWLAHCKSSELSWVTSWSCPQCHCHCLYCIDGASNLLSTCYLLLPIPPWQQLRLNSCYLLCTAVFLYWSTWFSFSHNLGRSCCWDRSW